MLETWELYGCYILNVNYNEMDYTASDPASISLSIQFDNALNTPIETGIGAQIGRTIGTIATG